MSEMPGEVPSVRRFFRSVWRELAKDILFASGTAVFVFWFWPIQGPDEVRVAIAVAVFVGLTAATRILWALCVATGMSRWQKAVAIGSTALSFASGLLLYHFRPNATLEDLRVELAKHKSLEDQELGIRSSTLGQQLVILVEEKQAQFSDDFADSMRVEDYQKRRQLIFDLEREVTYTYNMRFRNRVDQLVVELASRGLIDKNELSLLDKIEGTASIENCAYILMRAGQQLVAQSSTGDEGRVLNPTTSD